MNPQPSSPRSGGAHTRDPSPERPVPAAEAVPATIQGERRRRYGIIGYHLLLPYSILHAPQGGDPR